jgi:hypothetical protein
MELPAVKAIEAMQALANQICYYDLRLEEPFQVLSFLRAELAAEAASQDSPNDAQQNTSASDGKAAG